ncbi:MAG: EAL domain-containing protein [Selenomonadaceae bacterium]|nr:EAL domain-containing protein [Selenomonadaceae bacterium]
MEKYEFTKEQMDLIEGLRQPFAVYQLLNKKVVTLALSDGFCRLFGYKDRAQAYYDMDHDMYKNVHPDDAARIADSAIQFATQGGRYETIYRTKKKGTDEYLIIHSLGEHVITGTGERIAHVWYMDEGEYTEEDSSGLNRLMHNVLHAESILKANRYDYLTGLPSMTYFFELAEIARKEMQDEGKSPVLLYINLAGMKHYNYKHGFAEGDGLLRAFAKLLSSMFCNENCCRIGADHFAVVAEENNLEESLGHLFEEWHEKEAEAKKRLPIRIGIYPARIGNVPVTAAYDKAKIACDEIKGSYSSTFNYYSQALSDNIIKKQYILENIDRAIAEKWIQVYYQPIVRAATGMICDEEALARWIDPVKGFLPPIDFIPFLEDEGLIYKLDLYVLEQVLQDIRTKEAEGIHTVPHSVNLSRSDFDACDIVEEVRKRVDAAGVRRDRINVEITESVIGKDFEFMKEQVERFQALGFAVWMDDFGSGYSSLDVLRDIRFDLIKFDMGFMRKLDESQNGRIILTELIKMAMALNVETVCEGVETEDQVRFLQEAGCSKLQGYYFSKPVPFAQVLEWHKAHKEDGYENPEESSYHDSIGRINLFDLAAIAREEKDAFHRAFNTIPIGILEVRGDTYRFVRGNPSYRDFVKRCFSVELSEKHVVFEKYGDIFRRNVVQACCEQGNRSFYDEELPDGSMAHFFARRIGMNPVTGDIAVALAVLSETMR